MKAKVFTRTLIGIRKSIYRLLFVIDQRILNKQNNLVIFCYHSVNEYSQWKFSIPSSQFVKQIEHLLARGFNPIKLSDVENFLLKKGQLPRKAFVITFDDGYRDILCVREYLQKMRICPTVFLLASPDVADRSELGTNLEFLCTDEISTLISDGWEVGCHSDTHPDFGRLSEEQVKEQVITAKNKLQDALGMPIKFFSYPKGKYSQTILDAARQGQYSLGLTMDSQGLNQKCNLLTLGRVGVDSSHDFEEFKTLFTPSANHFRAFFKWTGLWKFINS